MALIAKIDPQEDIELAMNIRVHARGFENPQISIGDTAFIWTSESSGGQGLTARAKVKRISNIALPNKTSVGTHNEIVQNLEIENANPVRVLSLVQIGAHFDRGGHSSYRKLNRLLYQHAHNKIAILDTETANFLGSYFN